jgi:UDP-N-acetylglucosamine:LPS N-acetylglucosamine transferase
MYEALKAISQIPLKPLFITYRASHISQILEGYEVKYITHPRRNVFRLMFNALEAALLVVRFRPRIVITTGADVAVPFCVLSRIFGAKLIYIETAGNVYTPSLTGRILYPFASVSFVQWQPLLRHFPKAIDGGPLL